MGDSGCRSREQRAERVEGGLCGGRFVVEGGGGTYTVLFCSGGGRGRGRRQFWSRLEWIANLAWLREGKE